MNGTTGRHASHYAEDGSERAPQPAPAAGSERIDTIRAGQGARVTTRKNAREASARARHSAEERYYKRHPEARASAAGPQRSGKNVVLLVVAAVLALALIFLLARCVTVLLSPAPEEQADPTISQDLAPAPEEQVQEDAEQEQADATGSVSYQGITYTLETQESGCTGVVSTTSDGEKTVLFEIEGTPVAFMRNAATLLIPENRDDGWDVVCYVIDGHSDAGYISTMDGNPVQGSGDITSAQLEGTVIHVTDSTGASTDVALA